MTPNKIICSVPIHLSIVKLFAIAVFVSGSGLAMAQEIPGEPGAAPSATEKSEVQAASKPTAPLTIDQIRANLPPTVADRFEFLRKQRKSTLEALDETSTLSKTLAASINVVQNRKDALDAQDKENVSAVPSISKERMQSELRRAEETVTQLQQKLEAAKLNKTPQGRDDVAKLESTLEHKQTYSVEIREAINKLEQRSKDEERRKHEAAAAAKAVEEELARLHDQRDKAVQAQLSYQRVLGEIDDMVNQLFIASDATNSFKLKMSIMLSLLIAVVIGGFFIIAWSDIEVKRTIFSNEAGIQFITMFAIVISVILFGIIGVLESKELSALLGGLSGYILGKSKSVIGLAPQTASTGPAHVSASQS